MQRFTEIAKKCEIGDTAKTDPFALLINLSQTIDL